MRLALPLAIALTATTAHAEVRLAAQDTLADNIQTLSAMPDKTPSDQFALGAAHFLRGIEKTLQIRWQYNATLDDLDMPVLRLPVPPNPDAKPFEAALIANLFSELLTDMDASRAVMANIPDGADLAVNVNLADLWFDINMNSNRDIGEGVIEVASFAIMGSPDMGDADGLPPMDVRFDAADVAWLTAYTHLISASGELVLAFDPTKAIASVLNAAQKMDEMRGQPYTRNGFVGPRETRWIDQIAMVYGALNQQPDAKHTRAAHAHLLNMIAQNKQFWAMLAAETDNVNEWIPNGQQVAALGFELPTETGAAWQAVLDDAEALLNGELLISYWRIAPAGGVNVKKMFMDPPPVDIVTWFQGAGLLDYLQRGPVITEQSLRDFSELAPGNPFLFSFLLN